MKASTTLSGAIWVVIVGGNLVNVLTRSPDLFMSEVQFPWAIIFLPVVIAVGAFLPSRMRGASAVRAEMDRQLGEGTYRNFMRALKPELMFAAMCACIVLGGLVRQLGGTSVLPPPVLGFFATGAAAFLLAHFISLRRQAKLPSR
jgi:hypothetical protein